MADAANSPTTVPDAPDARRTYWADELSRAKRRFRTFWDLGDRIIDEYRIQKADGNDTRINMDRYNILYSSTETIKPNLYSQTPMPRVVLRSTDTATDPMRAAALLLEGCLNYVMKEEDFDELMDNAVEDMLLPGLGTAWVRYEATMTDYVDDDGQPVPDPNNPKQNQQMMLDESVRLEYVYWQDWVCGTARVWADVPWIGKRLYLTKEAATARFGAEKASKLQYLAREAQYRDLDSPPESAEAWEFWNKSNRTVYWYAESYPGDLLDVKPDPLGLKHFWPCPRPMRAIRNTRTFIPRALYSEYKAQAETLNVMTKRIRLLGEALRVVGLFDGSQAKLADVLNPAAGNRMIAVDSWATFAQNGGLKGSVEWVPIDTVVAVLTQLQQARETAKNEIYEITGFADIQRGVSKASETLGAQNIKSDWASARVKKMQAEVQRFARDVLAIAGEIICEHCDPSTIAIFSGISIPTSQQIQSDPAIQQQVQVFQQATTIMKNEIRRVSAIDIETDSTLLADESAERDDRTKFLAAAGAFLQQAVPAAAATPELGPLLGALLMFTVRTFPSSRPVEDEFEKVQQAFVANSQNPQNQDKDGHQIKAQTQMQQAQIEAQTAQARIQADVQLKNTELQIRQQNEQQQNQLAAAQEANRHAEKMLELQIREAELNLQAKELAQKAINTAIAKEQADTLKFTAIHNAAMAEITAGVDDKQAAAEEELEYDRMAQEERIAAADREASSALNGSQGPPGSSQAGDDGSGGTPTADGG